MSVTVRDLLKLYRFPLGRCVFALRSVASRARVVGWLEVEQLAERSADTVQRSMAMVLRFQSALDSQYPPEAVSLDSAVDRTIAGVHGYLGAQVRVYGDEPWGQAAGRILQALLPGGVAAVTQLPFTEQHEQVNVIIERAASPDLAADVSLLPEMPALIARLRERNDEYGKILRQVRDAPTRQEIQGATTAAQEYLAEVTALILGQHGLRAPVAGATATDHRDHLLEPILAQNEAIRLARRRNRQPADIDPQTGEELPTQETAPAADAPASPPATP